MRNEMKNDWNDRSKENAFYYISSFKDDWTEKEFFDWGKIQVEGIVVDFIENQGLNSSDWKVLEVGCGAGRMTRYFSKIFNYVYAYDVSLEMIQKASILNNNLDNIEFLDNDGRSFYEIESNSIDYVFSGWVFQHIPSKKIVKDNLCEISRVLKPDGKFQIHIGLADNFKSYLSGFLSGSQREYLAKFLLGDKSTSKKTFFGVTYTKSDFIKTLLKYDLDAIPKTHNYYNPWIMEEEYPIFFEGFKRKN